MSSSASRQFPPSGVEMRVEGGKLKYRVPAGAMTPELKDQLSANRERLLSIVSRDDSGSVLCVPQSKNQEALWFLRQIAPSTSSYHVALACRALSGIDAGILRMALSAQSARRAALRTTYAWLEGLGACQFVHRRLEPPFAVIPIEEPGEEALKAAARRFYDESFDLERDPPMRAALLDRGDGKPVLMLVLHHIACDAISLRIYVDGLMGDYETMAAGGEPAFDRDDGDYAEFSYRRAVFAETGEGRAAEQERFWADRLRGAPAFLELRSYLPRPPVPSFRGRTLKYVVGHDEYSGIARFAEGRSLTVASVLLSAFCVSLYRGSGVRDVVVGMPCAARSDAVDARTFGYAMNVVPLRLRAESGATFAGLCGTAMRAVGEALDRQDYPLSVLTAKLGAGRGVDRNPIFQVLFNYMNRRALGPLATFLRDSGGEPLERGPLSLGPWEFDSQEGQLDIAFEVVDDGRSLACAIKYSSDVLDPERASEFSESLLRALRESLARPDSLLSLGEEAAASGGGEPSAPPRRTALLAGTFTLDPIKPIFDFWAGRFALGYSAEVGPYNQLFQLLLDPSSSLSRNRDGVNALFVRVADWLASGADGAKRSGLEEAGGVARDFVAAVAEAERRNPAARFLIMLAPSPPGLNDRMGGWIRECEGEIARGILERTAAAVVGSKELVESYDVRDYYESTGEAQGHMPYTREFYASLGTALARKVAAWERAPFKAVVVDCDNTLWKGVVAEDGISGIEVTPGRARLQRFLLDCASRGMLLCLCSKNEEADVRRALREHPGMLIREDRIAYSRINWRPKSENLIELAAEMNIGLDAVAFIDDSPVECAEVAARVPEAAVLRLPESDEEIPRFILGAWLFDAPRTTGEDAERGRRYEEARKRELARGRASSFADFIASLGLEIRIDRLIDADAERVSQLTLRTNQFNASGRRRTPVELSAFAESPGSLCLAVRARDRFGDYGLVGAALAASRGSELFVDTFLLSCRALGKGVEHAMLARLGAEAREIGARAVAVHFVPTERNAPFRRFAESVAGEALDREKEIVLDADQAAAVAFDPSRAASVEPVESPGRDRAGTARRRAEPFQEVAEDLSTIERILEAVGAAAAAPPAAGKGGAPASAMEKVVAEAWESVTGTKPIGASDNFFDIGGTSLMIPQVVALLSRKHGISLSVTDVFMYPTVSQIAAHIAGGGEDVAPSAGKEAARMRREALRASSGAAERLRARRAPS